VDERRERVVAAIVECGADWAILSTPESIFYATGYLPAAASGPSPFDGGPPLALLARDGAVAFVLADVEAGDAQGGEVFAYHAFAPPALETSLQEGYAAAVRRAFDAVGAGGRVAVERSSFSVAAVENPVAFDAALARARMTKTGAEIETLRRSAELTAIGQRAARARLAVGVSELELLGAARVAMEAHAGEPLALSADLLSGERTLEVMGPAGPRRLREGDPVICDLVPRLGGYWGDSSTTWAAGEPSPALARMHAAVLRALEHAGEIVRPGLTAGALDDAVRGALADDGYHNPIHTGHGIGVASVEAPRIVPGDPTALEPGMVLMLEPAAYLPEVGGVRLEWMFLVNDGGAERISPYGQALTAEGET
jgi:Xaa-Pro aminopeptidase